MSGLAGTGLLLRLALRRDRVVLPAWLLGITLLVTATGASFAKLFASPAERAALAAGVAGNPGFRAVYGPAYDLTTVGGATSWRISTGAAIAAALMSIVLVVRHSRAEEEAGRAELVGAAGAGRWALLGTALLVAALADAGVAVLCAAGLVAVGQPLAGALALGLATGGAGLVFAGVAAVTAQLATTARAATGAAGALLGVAYVVRAGADLADSWLVWASPLGWVQEVRPFAGDRYAVLLLVLAATGLLVAVAAALRVGRDLGAGLIEARPGPARAGSRLRGTWGLTWRLQRAALLGWLAGSVGGGILLGALTRDVLALLAGNPQFTDILRQVAGGTDAVADAYRSVVLALLGIVAAAFAVQVVLRLRVEEASGRAEQVLATQTRRSAWALPALGWAAVGALVLLLGGGAGMAVGELARGGGDVGRLVAAAAAQAPASWVLAAAAFALAGAAPRLSALAWVLLGLAVLVVQVGAALEWPAWLVDASPFTHSPALPLSGAASSGLLGLLGVAVALTAIGLAGLRGRDLGA